MTVMQTLPPLSAQAKIFSFLSAFAALTACWTPSGTEGERRERPAFTPHLLFDDGTAGYGRTTLIDMDGDGDLDFVTGSTSITYWFEHVSADTWIPHRITRDSESDVGGVTHDFTGDGWPDHAAGTLWFENPGPGGDSDFVPRRSECMFGTHDMELADFDGDGALDIAALADGVLSGIAWCRYTGDPEIPWTVTRIDSLDLNSPEHSGLNVGDIDGDGDMDVSVVKRWIENVDGKGLVWQPHPLEGLGQYGSYGFGGQSQVADLDADGDNDIIVTEAEVPNGRVGWFENVDGRGLEWAFSLIKDSTDHQDFHSLAVEDFDGDGKLDIFSCGSQLVGDGDIPNRFYIWWNQGKGRFEEEMIYSGAQCHDAVAGDVDGDGDADIVANGWSDPRHYFLENRSGE